jgi:hypothetical protein
MGAKGYRAEFRRRVIDLAHRYLPATAESPVLEERRAHATKSIMRPPDLRVVPMSSSY